MERTNLKTPLGNMILEMDDSGIQRLEFTDQQQPKSNAAISANLKTVVDQINDYFEGNLDRFDLPLAPKGTEFQNKVWQELQKIPFGKTISYQELANRLGDPLVIRAAASANGKNPIAIIIPCHRVLGADSLGGFSGAGGVETKVALLRHEGADGLLI